MTLLWIVIPVVIAALAVSTFIVFKLAKRRHIDRWIVPYLAGIGTRRRPQPGEPIHLLLCIADHYEPKLGGAPPDLAKSRVDAWVRNYPRLFAAFRDSDGHPPRHTFFYPIEEYEPEYLDALADLCRAGYGEVEVHLHHDDDTAENLRRSLLDFKTTLANRHGLLARDPVTGDPVYAFIHGNWALDNSRSDGRWCGVNNELDVLRETGCYVDMTMPSAPSSTQTRTLNSIYYAVDDPVRPKSHDRGVAVGSAPAPPDSLMLIQGPLILDWSRRRAGIVPAIENGCIQGNQPAHDNRIDAWLASRVQIASRPDWFFVKLHTHGSSEENQKVLLGQPMVEFHKALARRAEADANFHFHYVTAREMYNLAIAAEAGWRGSVSEARDYRLRWESRESDGVSTIGQAEEGG